MYSVVIFVSLRWTLITSTADDVEKSITTELLHNPPPPSLSSLFHFRPIPASFQSLSFIFHASLRAWWAVRVRDTALLNLAKRRRPPRRLLMLLLLDVLTLSICQQTLS